MINQEFAIGFYSVVMEGGNQSTTYYYGDALEVKKLFEPLWQTGKNDWRYTLAIDYYENEEEMRNQLEYEMKVWIDEETTDYTAEFIDVGSMVIVSSEITN